MRLLPIPMDETGAPAARVKRAEWSQPVFTYRSCISCLVCVDACPTEALSAAVFADKSPLHATPCLSEAKTYIGCGFCAQECPTGAIGIGG